MRVTLKEDGIYGKAGDEVDIGVKMAKELNLIGPSIIIETLTEEKKDEVIDETLTEEKKDEVIVTTKVKKAK